MENKFNLSVEDNIFIAKRNIIDTIYKSARLEGIAVTFPQTEAIYQGVNVSSLTVDEITIINNLKHAWQFLFETMNYPQVDFAYICEINKIVGSNLFHHAGFIRNVPVTIGGTNWQPEIPFRADIIDNLNKIQEIQNSTEKAIGLMLYLMRSQAFIDGNKRTAMLCANRILIENGAGIISIPVEKISEFKTYLLKYYETNNTKEIQYFIYHHCIDGLTIKQPTLAEQEERKQQSELFNHYRQNHSGCLKG